jgi:hypothetical protein
MKEFLSLNFMLGEEKVNLYLKMYKNLYSAYPALAGGSRR